MNERKIKIYLRILRILRKKIAAEENVPPFIIFSDSTLKEMSRYFPSDEASMLQIKGVGQSKFSKYGQAFIDSIKEFVLQHSIQISNRAIPAVKGEEHTNSNEQQSHLISHEWYTQGLTIDEIAKKRQLSKITVQKHIIRSAEEGHEMKWNEIFDDDTEKRVLDTIRDSNSDKLKPIYEALNGEIDYFVIQAIICKNQL